MIEEAERQHGHHRPEQRYSVLRHNQNSKIPTEEQLTTCPIAAKNVAPASIARVRGVLNDTTTVRFDSVLQLLFEPPMEAVDERPPPTAVMGERQMAALLQAGVCEPADKSATRGIGIPFFVVEEKQRENSTEMSERLRFIYWTKRHNEALSKINYKCDVPLEHINKYLDRVCDEVGATADFTSGFYQVEIPAASRSWYRFADAAGNVYQMRRMPMGLRIAVEIMQTIAEAVCGTTRVCSEKCVISGVCADVWVDDVRISGEKSRVEHACAKINARADEMSITFKKHISFSSSYVCLGVSFDHAAHTVSVSHGVELH